MTDFFQLHDPKCGLAMFIGPILKRFQSSFSELQIVFLSSWEFPSSPMITLNKLGSEILLIPLREFFHSFRRRSTNCTVKEIAQLHYWTVRFSLQEWSCLWTAPAWSGPRACKSFSRCVRWWLSSCWSSRALFVWVKVCVCTACKTPLQDTRFQNQSVKTRLTVSC